MDSSEPTDTGFVDQLGQQQEFNPASSEEASISLSDEFQQLLNGPVSALPLFPDPFGWDYSNADILSQLSAEDQVMLDGNFGIEFMTEDFSWTTQSHFITWEVVSQQAEVQPGANTPWPSAPSGAHQSDPHYAQQDILEMPLIGDMPFYGLNVEISANQPVEEDKGAAYIPASAG
ncbi:1-phosphatidylinositol 3-phosphate 5-kinase isoform X3 [Lasiodiplodia theobromae]|uniref:1-phosphatidylinositol 3-phosphate 5-kinase isoform X3 n=1 Tax=Lasiodiplodia theobromae TaxID=45133 RepID=UPI0015C34F07|nr:1-phosphatidylinositol 3-phosphate 5-kinase isoform X3 [Lasiodiplodia theobromae]KAF4541802.1 1-phosphatidylinositol 3-phosphate 5-kinase isoform X3 [Lasiodiplodia theobromae]